MGVMVPINLFLLIINITHGFKECNTTIRTKAKLGVHEQMLHFHKYQNTTLKVVHVPSYITLTAGKRKVYNFKQLEEFGVTTEVNENINVLPSKTELLEWKTRGQCKIGTICKVGGNCWGSGAKECDSNPLTTWVKKATITKTGDIWNKKLYRTCIKDWGCEIITKDVPLKIGTNGIPYIRVDETRHEVDNRYQNNFFMTGFASVVFDTP